MIRIAILDDYQKVARRMAPWDRLPADVQVEFFADHLDDPDAVVERLRDFDIVGCMRERTPLPRAVIERLPKLKMIATTGMRNAAIDMKATAELGILISGSHGTPHGTVELTWGLLLALVRQIPREEAATRAGSWQTTVGFELAGCTLGIAGLGRIGSQVAKVGVAFGMRVIAWSQNLTAARAAESGATLVNKDQLLAEADVLTLHLVLSQRTRGLIGASELAAMKAGAYLVNTSRGPLIDTPALIAALERGRLAGAAVDVYDIEPLPPDAPLRRAPNLLLTPHLGYVTDQNYRVFYGETFENIEAYLAGKPMRVITL